MRTDRDNVRVVLQDPPTRIKGFVLPDATDDFYTIILNARHSRETNIETYKHELDHIENGDFYKDESANEIELRAHRVS